MWLKTGGKRFTHNVSSFVHINALKLFQRVYRETVRLFERKDGLCQARALRKSSPVTGLEWPRGFQEVKVPRLHDNGTGWW